MNIFFEFIVSVASGMYVGFIAFWNALGIKEAIENAFHQVIATGLGIPLIVVSAASIIVSVGRFVLKRVF